MTTTRRRKSGDGSGWVILLASLFAAGSLGIGVWLGRDLLFYFQVRSWEETPAKILHAEQKCVQASSKGHAYRAKVEYEYGYGGQSYKGSRIGVDDSAFGEEEPDFFAKLRGYQKSGVLYRCYVNPGKPAEAVLRRDLPWPTLIVPAGAMLLFGGFGFGLLALLLIGRRGRRRELALAQAHPDEPWLWKKEWASGRIRSSSGSLVGPLVFAAFWNVFCLTACLAFVFNRPPATPRGHQDEQLFWWFIIPFGSIGLALIGWAAVSVARWWKYRRSLFEMASVPGVVGGQLAGVIRVPVKIQTGGVFRLRLNCINCVTSRGSNNDAIKRNLLWQDELVVSHDLLEGDASHSAIPVMFQIPYECRQSDESDADNMVLWNLEATAKTPGVDFAATFEVPVFKTVASDPHFVIDRNLIAKYAAPEDADGDLREAGVVKRLSPSGEGWEFVFPMARHPGVALGFTAGMLLCMAIAFFLPYLDFGWLTAGFGALFGLVGLVLLAVVADLWFYRSVVDVSQRGLTVTGGLFGRGSPRWIQATDVIDIKLVSNMSSDKLMYFDLVIVCGGAKRVTAGKWLPGRRLATSVMRQIEQAMGRVESGAGS